MSLILHKKQDQYEIKQGEPREIHWPMNFFVASMVFGVVTFCMGIVTVLTNNQKLSDITGIFLIATVTLLFIAGGMKMAEDF